MIGSFSTAILWTAVVHEVLTVVFNFRLLEATTAVCAEGRQEKWPSVTTVQETFIYSASSRR